MLLREELESIHFGLNLAWNLGCEHINLQIDSTLVMCHNFMF